MLQRGEWCLYPLSLLFRHYSSDTLERALAHEPYTLHDRHDVCDRAMITLASYVLAGR